MVIVGSRKMRFPRACSTSSSTTSSTSSLSAPLVHVQWWQGACKDMVDIHRDKKEEEDTDTVTEVNPRQEERVSEEAQQMLREEMEQVKSLSISPMKGTTIHWHMGRGVTPLLKPKVRVPPPGGLFCSTTTPCPGENLSGFCSKLVKNG